MLGVFEGIEDRVKEKFTKVVDGVGDQGGDRKVVCDALAVFQGERFKINAGEVEEGCAVVGGELVLGLVVVGADAVEGSVDNRLNRVECVEDLFALVEVFAGIFVLVQAQLNVGDSRLCVNKGILGCGLVKTGSEVGEEVEALIVVWSRESAGSIYVLVNERANTFAL